MKHRRMIAWVMAAALAVSSAVLPAAAYSDVDPDQWSWAWREIDAMTERGIFKGYDDGAFMPAAALPASQALALAARLRCPDEALRLQVGQDRREEVRSLLGEGLAWLWDEAAVCLEAGIVSHDELAALCAAEKLGDPLPMENFCVYIARAMGLEPMVKRLTGCPLSYADADKVSEACRPYVYALTVYSVVRGDGVNLNPKVPVNRAQAAVILSRALECMAGQGLAPELEEYTDYDWIAGILESVSVWEDGFTLILEDDRGETRRVLCGWDVKVYRDNFEGKPADLTPGEYVRVCLDDEGNPAAVRRSGVAETLSGGVSRLENDREVQVEVDGEVRAFAIGRFTQVRVEEALGGRELIEPEAQYTSAKCWVDDRGELVFLELEGGTHEAQGVVIAVEATEGGHRLTVCTVDGAVEQFTAPETAAVTVSGAAGALDGSAVGRYAVMRISNLDGGAVKVALDGAAQYRQGTVQGVNTASDDRTVTIIPQEGVISAIYPVAEEVIVTYCGVSADLQDLRKDWYVTVRVVDGKVTRIDAFPAGDVAEGTVEEVTFQGDTAALTVRLEDGRTVDYTLDLDCMPAIIRDGAVSSIEKIRRGDGAKIILRSGEVIRVECAARSVSVSGVLQRKVEELEGVTLELLLPSGETGAYLVGQDASVLQDGAASDLGSVTLGSRLTLTVSGGEVRSIQVDEAGAGAGEVSGTILFINPSDRTVLLKRANGATVTVKIPSGVSIQDGEGKKTDLSGLARGDSLRVQGSYEGQILTATAVTVE